MRGLAKPIVMLWLAITMTGCVATGGTGAYSASGSLNCSDFSGPVYVGSSDPHGLDHDGDGVGCE